MGSLKSKMLTLESKKRVHLFLKRLSLESKKRVHLSLKRNRGNQRKVFT